MAIRTNGTLTAIGITDTLTTVSSWRRLDTAPAVEAVSCQMDTSQARGENGLKNREVAPRVDHLLNSLVTRTKTGASKSDIIKPTNNQVPAFHST